MARFTRLTEREVASAAAASSAIERESRRRISWELRAELERPLPRLPDPATRCRVIEPMRFAEPGRETRVAQAGEIIALPSSLARSLAGIGRVFIL